MHCQAGHSVLRLKVHVIFFKFSAAPATSSPLFIEVTGRRTAASSTRAIAVFLIEPASTAPAVWRSPTGRRPSSPTPATATATTILTWRT